MQPARRTSPLKVLPALALLALACASCGTLDSQISYWSEDDPNGPDTSGLYVYGGIAGDVDWMRRMVGGDRWANPEVFILIPALVIDVPLSLIADTLLLPMTLVQQAVD